MEVLVIVARRRGGVSRSHGRGSPRSPYNRSRRESDERRSRPCYTSRGRGRPSSRQAPSELLAPVESFNSSLDCSAAAMYSDDASMAPPASGISATPASSPRYIYLVARLRNRQITMDEATELFGLQQSTMSALLTRAQAEPSATASLSQPTPTAPSAAASGPVLSDDTVWLGLLAVGAGAGLFAALLQRARDGGARTATTTKAASGPR
jgi:hypothetical protein